MTIKELQSWVERDWQRSPQQPDMQLQLIYLFEELGEMAEAIRKRDGSKARKTDATDLEGEMADVLISITTIANHFDIDLTEAVSRCQKKIEDRHEQGY